MKDFLVIITSTIVFSAAILGAALVVALLVYEFVAPSPAPTPTTYQTGLYVESENIQPARGDLQ